MEQLKLEMSERVRSNPAFRLFLTNLPLSFDTQGTEIHSARNKLRIMDVTNLGVDGLTQVMVKRYHRPWFFQKIDYTFLRQPKCRRAFYNTAELRHRGFQAAEELGYVEVWKHRLYQHSYYVCEVAAGMRLDNLVMDMRNQGNTNGIKHIIKQFATLVKRLHEHGVLYYDMNCGNVICKQVASSNEWLFTLIDTNRVRLYPPGTSLGLNIVVGDLILMNPKMGTVEMFQAEYLRQRGLYTPELASRIRDIQRQRYEKKKPLKSLFQRFKSLFLSALHHLNAKRLNVKR